MDETDRDSLPIEAFGPKSDLTASAISEIIPMLAQPPPALAPKAARSMRKTYGDTHAPEAIAEALRVWFAALVYEAGKRIAPACDILAGSGAEQLMRAWPESSLRDQVARRCAVFAERRGDGFTDIFHRLYESIFPREVRHAAGEHYTPQWLVEHVLDRAGLTGDVPRRVVDPSCGSGSFLVRAARRLHAGGHSFIDLVCGFDVNPLAVIAARVNLLSCLGEDERNVTAPPHVYRRDAILSSAPGERFDFVVGNPPWVLWDNLPAEYREQTTPLWKHYGLFSLSHREARLGGGKKDLAMLFTYAAADRLLDDGGTLAFVINLAVVRGGRAGAGFRRFRIGGNGPELRVVRFDDLSALAPFDAAVKAGVIVLEKGRTTSYPVTYGVWSLEGGERRCAEHFARPVREADATSSWEVVDSPAPASRDPAADPAYQARTGAFTGGANGVFWIEILAERGSMAEVRNIAEAAKAGIEQRTGIIEAGLIFPLLRWRDVGRWSAHPGQHILMVQDAAARQPMPERLLHSEFPATYDWLDGFRAELLARRSSMIRSMMERGAFYAMFGIGDYTLSPCKVVWRRMVRRFTAAVVGAAPVAGVPKPVIPQETLTFIPCSDPQEAHYLCALLNSPQATDRALAFAVPGGKSFGGSGMIAHLGLPKFDAGDSAHAELAKLSQAAHEQVAAGANERPFERRIEMIVGEMGVF